MKRSELNPLIQRLLDLTNKYLEMQDGARRSEDISQKES